MAGFAGRIGCPRDPGCSAGRRPVIGHIFVNWLYPFKEHRIVEIGSQGAFSYVD